jgi:soluble lytic murein transglycosylase-like protein
MRSVLLQCREATKGVHGGAKRWTTLAAGSWPEFQWQGSLTQATPTAAPKVPAGIDDLIVQAATRHGLDPNLLRAIAWVESHFNSSAVSPAGARGLMQVMPATARRFGYSDVSALLNPAISIEVGAKYLAYLQRQFGNLSQIVPAYNAGEGAVRRYGGRCPPYRETRSYVLKVASAYQQFRQQQLGRVSAPAQRPA